VSSSTTSVQTHTTLDVPSTPSLPFLNIVRQFIGTYLSSNYFLPISPSQVLPSSTIRFSSKVAARRRSLSTTSQRRTVAHMIQDPPMQTLLTPVSSASTLSFCVSSPPSFSPRAVAKENPNEPTPLSHYCGIGKRGGTEYPYGTSDISPGLVSGSRNDLLVSLFRN